MSVTVAKPKRGGLIGFLGRSLSLLALCVSGLAAVVLIVIPLATGSQTYSVLTSSMAPKYPPGTFLVVKPEPFESLRVGDVITYQIESGRPEVITHRIVSVGTTQTGDRTLVLKGDNNDVEDELPVQEVQVRGKLFYAVPYVGWVANALGQSDRSAFINWAAAGLIGYGVFSITRGIIITRRKRRAL